MMSLSFAEKVIPDFSFRIIKDNAFPSICIGASERMTFLGWVLGVPFDLQTSSGSIASSTTHFLVVRNLSQDVILGRQFFIHRLHFRKMYMKDLPDTFQIP